jgi:hypothetical protein
VIALKTPLRWYGHLRSEPARLSWGIGLEIELSVVEIAAGMMPITGGMRTGFTPKEERDGGSGAEAIEENCHRATHSDRTRIARAEFFMGWRAGGFLVAADSARGDCAERDDRVEAAVSGNVKAPDHDENQ